MFLFNGGYRSGYSLFFATYHQRRKNEKDEHKEACNSRPSHRISCSRKPSVIPVFGSKCSPVQHIVNIVSAVLLGPYYGIASAFLASLIRNLIGLGSLLAFPGSMIGALLCGLLYKKTGNLILTLLGEVFGTAVLGGLCAYPVAILFMGKDAAGLAFYAYIIPFFISTAAGAIIAGVLLTSLKKTGVLRNMQEALAQ